MSQREIRHSVIANAVKEAKQKAFKNVTFDNEEIFLPT